MIEVKHLTKRYGNHTAVDDLSFTLEEGRIYGFLGPNGAGKSTTMNMITGCLAATSGEIRIDGLDIYEDSVKAKQHIGYLPEQPPLYTDMTPREYLEFVAKAKGVPAERRTMQVELAMDQTGLSTVADRLIKNLSKGYRQRTGIAQALLGSPQTIILDEPTVGLDPKQMIEIRSLITELGKEHTVILSSHILSEVQAVCDYILMISHGKLVASDTPENLERLLAGKLSNQLVVEGKEAAVREALSGIEGISKCTTMPAETPGQLQVLLEQEDTAERRPEIIFALAEARILVYGLTQSKVSLEDVFLELTADKPESKPESKPEPEEAAAETGPEVKEVPDHDGDL